MQESGLGVGPGSVAYDLQCIFISCICGSKLREQCRFVVMVCIVTLGLRTYVWRNGNAAQ